MRFFHDGNFKTDSQIRFTLAFGKDFHVTVWKIMVPLVLLATLCMCILHWAGVL
jgi:hypothetical protein